MNDYKKMPYAIPEDYMELAKARTKATIALQSRQNRGFWTRYRITFAAAAACCIGIIALGIGEKRSHTISYEDFRAQLEKVPTEVLYDISGDIIEYSDEYEYSQL